MTDAEGGEKVPQIDVRDVPQQTWAGAIAVMAWVGFLLLLGVLAFFEKLDALKEVITALGTLMGVITTFYFTREK